MTGAAAVYRFFDRDDRLLYIGASRSPMKRFGQHALEKPGCDQIARIEIAWYPAWSDALAAEKAAIKNEQPPWNVQHTPRHREHSLRHLEPVSAARMSELVDMVVNWKPRSTQPGTSHQRRTTT